MPHCRPMILLLLLRIAKKCVQRAYIVLQGDCSLYICPPELIKNILLIIAIQMDPSKPHSRIFSNYPQMNLGLNLNTLNDDKSFYNVGSSQLPNRLNCVLLQSFEHDSSKDYLYFPLYFLSIQFLRKPDGLHLHLVIFRVVLLWVSSIQPQSKVFQFLIRKKGRM